MEENIKERKLIMTFDPLVIDDLGAKLYSTIPPIISELIANGYDACAKKVWIELIGNNENKTIKIKDNGFGMNFEDIQRKYLKIGRKRRESEPDCIKKCGRLPMGKKGLGKLAFFGIADKAIIETVQEGKKIIFEMDWKAIQEVPEGDSYKPKFNEEETDEDDGTTVTLTKIHKKTEFDIESFKKNISNYFIFDTDFKVFIKCESDADFTEIDNSLRYNVPGKKKEFFWKFPREAIKMQLSKEFPFVKNIKGEIITFDKPVPPRLRGVTLFSRKKLVNLPEFFPKQGSSHFYQYLTGWLEIDFIDDFKPDVIATNRSSLNWNDPNLRELKLFFEKTINIIHDDWRKLWEEKTKREISKKFNINPITWRESNKNNPTLKKNIAKFTKMLGETEKIEREELVKVSEIIYDLAPEYAEFVLWRNLNEKIKENKIIKEKFFDAKYLEATREAVQIYNEYVQEISGYSEDGFELMEKSYGKEEHKVIWITKKSNENEKNMEEGQKLLSQGIMKGFKNPAVSHTSITRGIRIKDFSDKNCLDILNTISYLFDRLEKRIKPSENSISSSENSSTAEQPQSQAQHENDNRA
jgi:uncharacterized protein (TIGR02391 family)